MIPLRQSQYKALLEIIPAAIECEQKTGCPRELTVAQWALESGWGTHAPGNNFFGIKWYQGAYGSQTLKTLEYVKQLNHSVAFDLTFATFPNAVACFDKHAQLITEGKPYRQAWDEFLTNGDPMQLIDNIAKVYATDPEYASKLKAVLVLPEVEKALKNA